MRDYDENLVEIIEDMNSHYLVTGKPGAGKTYWGMHKIQELAEEGKRALILDFSGSYTRAEVAKSNPELLSKIKYVGARDSDSIHWKNNYPSKSLFYDDVTDSIIKILGIRSYYQKKLLREAVENQLKDFTNFSFPMLVFTIEKMLGLVEPKEDDQNIEKMLERMEGKVRTIDDMKNLERLLSRLAPYEHIFNFGIMNEVKEDALITVIQLHEMPLLKKKFLTSFILEMIWNELKFDQPKRHCDVLVLDEFQFLPFSEDDALPNLLRESRKFGLEMILISQFIGNYSKAQISALVQVGQKLFFRPAESELKFVAKLISTNHAKEWMGVLDNLSRGEAVYKGSYTLNDNETVHTNPLVCRI